MNAGALELDAGADFAWLMGSGWGIRYRSGITALSFTRNLLDFVVRRRISQIANIEFLEETDVIALRATPNGDRVTGVTIRERHVEGRISSTGRDLEADLVVVASGRNSKLPAVAGRARLRGAGRELRECEYWIREPLLQHPRSMGV